MMQRLNKDPMFHIFSFLTLAELADFSSTSRSNHEFAQRFEEEKLHEFSKSEQIALLYRIATSSPDKLDSKFIPVLQRYLRENPPTLKHRALALSNLLRCNGLDPNLSQAAGLELSEVRMQLMEANVNNRFLGYLENEGDKRPMTAQDVEQIGELSELIVFYRHFSIDWESVKSLLQASDQDFEECDTVLTQRLCALYRKLNPEDKNRFNGLLLSSSFSSTIDERLKERIEFENVHQHLEEHGHWGVNLLCTLTHCLKNWGELPEDLQNVVSGIINNDKFFNYFVKRESHFSPDKKQAPKDAFLDALAHNLSCLNDYMTDNFIHYLHWNGKDELLVPAARSASVSQAKYLSEQHLGLACTIISLCKLPAEESIDNKLASLVDNIEHIVKAESRHALEFIEWLPYVYNYYQSILKDTDKHELHGQVKDKLVKIHKFLETCKSEPELQDAAAKSLSEITVNQSADEIRPSSPRMFK